MIVSDQIHFDMLVDGTKNHILYKEEKGYCSRIDGTVELGDVETVKADKEADCTPLCDADNYCYGFNYEAKKKLCWKWKLKGNIKGSEDSRINEACFIKNMHYLFSREVKLE